MSTSPPADTIRDEALALGASGSWRAVASLLAPLATGAFPGAELALLYAEARMRCGEEREAQAWLDQVMPHLALGVDRGAHRRAMNMLGAAALATGQLAAAEGHFGEALEMATQESDLLLLAQASNNLGTIANLRGQHEVALWHYRIALPTLQRLGQTRRLAEGYHNMAITARDLGELEEADEHERRAIDYATTADAARVIAMCRVGRAEIALRRGDAAFAEITARLAADELAKLADPLNEADALRLVATSLTAQGRAREALDVFGAALSLATAHGHRLVEAEVRRDRAQGLHALGATADAAAEAREAIAIFTALGAAGEVAALQKWLAEPALEG